MQFEEWNKKYRCIVREYNAKYLTHNNFEFNLDK